MSDIALNNELPVGAVEKRATGRWAMIFLIFTEGALFAYLLFTYYYLAAQPHPYRTFPQGGPLSMKLALPDTVILLLSSVAVIWGEKGIKKGNNRRLLIGLGLCAVLGMIFLAVQYYEWAGKKFRLASSTYSSLYFTVTGFHMAHVLAGVVMLWSVFAWAAMGKFDRVRHTHVSVAAMYWHFVDAVWLTVFFTFYITPLLGLQK